MKTPLWRKSEQGDAALTAMVSATSKLGTDRTAEILTEVLESLDTDQLVEVAVASIMRLMQAAREAEEVQMLRDELTGLRSVIETYTAEDEVPSTVAARLIEILGLS